MDISIIIPTYNRNAIFLKTLQYALNATQNTNAEIIVVNDSKTQKVVLPLTSEKVTLYNNPSPGAASARNLGAKNAKGSLLLFLDDDIIISEKNINDVFLFHKKYPEACLNFNWKFPDSIRNNLPKNQFGRFLVATNLINYKGWVHHPNWNDNEMFEVNKLSAFFFVIPKSIFLKSGGFNESFKNQSVEDDEFSKRLLEMGIKQFIDPTKYVLHNEQDKLTIESRLLRLKIASINRKQALEMGMKEYYLYYPAIKIIVYSIVSQIKDLLIFFLKFIPNKLMFDFIYRMIVHLLIGTVIFEGYYKKGNH